MKKIAKTYQWLLILFSLVIVLGTIYSMFTYQNLGLESKQKVIEITEKEIRKELEVLEKQLQADFQFTQEIAETYAKEIEENPFDFRNTAVSFPVLFTEFNFSAIGIHPSISFSKRLLQKDSTYRVKDNKYLWSPFYKKGEKATRVFPYDYTNAQTSGKYWYSEDLKKGNWTAPYMETSNERLVISYRTPIAWDAKAGKNKGIVCLDYGLDYLQEKVANLHLYKKGYGIIIDENEVIISHPTSSYLGKKITEIVSEEEFFRMSALPENQFLPIDEYADRIVDRNLYFKHRIKATHTEKPIVYTAIIILKESETLTVFSEDNQDPTASVKSLRLQIICGCILILSLLIFWCFLWFKKVANWIHIALQTIVYIVGTLVIIYVQLQTPLYSFSNTDIEIIDETELNAYKNALSRIKKGQEISMIKTGFFIQNVKFSSANDLNITGYFWQKLGDTTALTSKFQGTPITAIVKPDFPEAESLTLELVSKEAGIVLWYFSAEIRQSFDYSNYPFDEESIWLRVRPKKAYQEEVLFLPDFDSYFKFVSQNDYYLNPNIAVEELKNGLEKDLFIEGWEIVRTSFSIRDRLYATSFGKFDLKEQYSYPELYFNISIKRRFLEVFVVYFIPILVTAFLLFTVLMTYTRNTIENEFYGFSVSTVLGFCASLFFVIIVSHMSLRESLQTGSIIYLEYFFFCLYFLISIVSIGAILFSSSTESSFFNKGNGLVIKMMYWPLFCFMIFIWTTVHFSIP